MISISSASRNTIHPAARVHPTANPRPHTVRVRHPVALFFALAYGFSWLIWAPLWLPALGVHGLPVLPMQHALGALGPISAALAVSGMEAGRSGPRDLLRRMALWRGSAAWVFVAVLGPLALLTIGLVVATVMRSRQTPLISAVDMTRHLPPLSSLAFFATNVLAFGLGEEVGWRGFALPRLQTKHSALVATILLTIGWAFWHAPLFLYRPGFTDMGVAGAAAWLFSLITGAVLLTWLYNESHGSLLVVALFHAGIDVVFTPGLSTPVVMNTAGALITIWGAIVVVAAGPRYLARHGKMIKTANGTGNGTGVVAFLPRSDAVARSVA